MNAPHLAPDRRAIHQPNAMQPPLWMPPHLLDPEREDLLAGSPPLRYRNDYFEAIQ